MNSISITESVYGGTDQLTQYQVSSDLTISGDASLLVPSHNVELTGVDQVVKTITIK